MSTKEEINYLVERIKNGEQNLMSELWDNVERLVAWRVNQIVFKLPASAAVTFDDLYNSGYLALDRAVRFYKRETGEFISLFMLCLKSAFAEASGARSEKSKKDPLRQAGTESLNAPLPGTDELFFEDTIADDRDAFEKTEDRIFREQLHDELERALSAIPEAEAEVLRLRFYNGATLKETGDVIGSCPEWTRQLENKGLRHLRAPKISRPLRQFIEENTPYYLHVGPQRFSTTHTSSVEEIALKRERLREQYVNAVLREAERDLHDFRERVMKSNDAEGQLIPILPP